MPNPAFEKLKQVVGSVAVVGDKVVRRAAGGVTSRFRSPEPVPVAPPAPAPVTKAAPKKSAPSKTAATSSATTPGAASPSPASIAKNVAHERPTVKPAPARKVKSDDSPGGKLPPRRS